jgi:cytochrome c-type biogenesis protein CcmH
MLFWILAGLLTLLVAALLVRPLLGRRRAGPAAEATDQAIYRDQLAEVDRDVARGILEPAEAERARTEIARRLLAADRVGGAALAEAPARASHVAVALSVLLVLGTGFGLYAAIGRPGLPDLPRAQRLAEAEALRAARPSQAEAEAEAARALPPPAADLPDDYAAMIAQLREVVPQRPDDLQGWELLALHEARIGDYAAAARAQERVIALKGEAATVEDWVGLADRMVAAAGGYVSPEAEAVLTEILRRDDRNVALLYYLGLIEAQTGRYDRAFPLWRRVVEEGPDGLHRRLALGQIADVAWLAGVDYAPPAPSRGPSAEQAAAAEDMDPEARAAMIRGMVEGLRERLEAEGGTAEEWAQLVNALAVVGDREGALAALAAGRAAHEGDAAGLASLATVARQVGLEPAP